MVVLMAMAMLMVLYFCRLESEFQIITALGAQVVQSLMTIRRSCLSIVCQGCIAPRAVIILMRSAMYIEVPGRVLSHVIRPKEQASTT